jgi:DNA-binding LacI/PurR family transcriptional regulator
VSSIKEIAKLVGVSPASISIYLNNKDTNRVSAKTKELIDDAVKQLNYHKNVFASSLSTQESRLIGVIIPTELPLFQNDYTNAILAGLQSRLSKFNYGMLFFPSSAKSTIEIVKEQLERSAGCDGYILFSTGFCTMKQNLKNIEKVRNTGKPFVTLNLPPVEKQVNQVLIDGLKQALGVEHLLELGHQRLLVLLGREGGVHTQFLKDDAVRMLQNRGLPHEDQRFIYGDYDDITSYQAISESLRRFPDTTGICCMSDIMAAAALKAVEASGRTVPSDVSIIGRNNSIHSRLTTPEMTTVDLHMHQAGASAANLLLENLDGNRAGQKLMLTSSIVHRGSTQQLKG